MSLELLLPSLLLLAALVPLARVVTSTAGRVALALLAAAGLAGGWFIQREQAGREARLAAARQKAPREGGAEGYVGASACRACHPGEFGTWHDSYHRTMTQYPGPDNVRGDFNNVTLTFDGDTYHLQRDADGYWVDMVDPDWKYAQTLKRVGLPPGRPGGDPQAAAASAPAAPRVRARISLMTGSHHMQTYWVPSAFGNLQFNLPFTYLFEDGRWAPRHDVFLLNPEKHYSMQLWNMTCLNCHATAGQPRQDPKTKELDSQAAEMGISCEACHGPGAEHVRANLSPGRRYRMHRDRAGDPTIFNPARAGHVKASETCGQCHAIRRKLDGAGWLQHGLKFKAGDDLEAIAPLVTYEDPNLPGTPDRKRAVMEGSFWPDGQVRVSGRDFNGLAASPCYQRGELSCLSCHAMHGYQDRAHQLAPRMESNAACLQCHPAIGTQLTAHTHHAPGSTGSLCYNCHMPHTSYGLLKAIRSHTITSPSARETIEAGRPNACNLCHLDRTIDWTANHLSAWYRQPRPPLSGEHTNLSAAVDLLLRGDAGQRAVVAWHFGWAPAREVSGEHWFAPILAPLLSDPYSVVRYVAQRSLRRLPGYATFNYDYLAPPAEREAARARARQQWPAPAPGTARPGTLLRPDGTVDDARLEHLLKQRNDRAMELLE